jgi:hypothetical protein
MIDEEMTNDVRLEAPVQETTVEAPSEKVEGLSNREALEEAIGLHRDEKPEASTPTKAEVTQAVEADIEAPSEFSAAGKAAWRLKDISGIQKEFRRIHDSRTAEITRAQQSERAAREEGKTWRELGKMAAPYIEARGTEGVTPEKAMMEALALINEFKKGDPGAIKAELKKLGIDLDRGTPSQVAALPKEYEEKFTQLQEVANEYKRDKEEAHFQRTVQTFEQVFDKLTSEKTRTGETVFPDLLDNSEKGIQFAQELGSLIRDDRFKAGVLRRFPEADLPVMVREAYKYLGGRVSGEAVKVSAQASEQHIQKSRRAAAASPGRTAPRVNDSNLQGKLSTREALMKAIELHRGQ